MWCSLCDGSAVLLVVTPTLDNSRVEREPVCAEHLADACQAITAQRGYAVVRPLTYDLEEVRHG